jgi:hypothetical protein
LVVIQSRGGSHGSFRLELGRLGLLRFLCLCLFLLLLLFLVLLLLLLLLFRRLGLLLRLASWLNRVLGLGLLLVTRRAAA